LYIYHMIIGKKVFNKRNGDIEIRRAKVHFCFNCKKQ
jgi:hypothetical protein